jgi:hypothetical protein
MTHQYSYFRFDGDLDSSRSFIEGAIGCPLSERDSSYWGGTYFLLKDAASGFRLQLHGNVDHTGEWINGEFPGSPVVCSLSGPVGVVKTFVAKIADAGGVLLASRTLEIDDDDDE